MDITAPADFPMSDYMEVEARIAAYLGNLGVDAATVPGFSGYAGGWNGLVLRFRAADEDGAVATESLRRHQGGLSNEERYLQERSLFGFFASCMSAVESCCFGIYHIGRIKQPSMFSSSDHDVTLRATWAAVSTAFPGTALDVELSRVRTDRQWIDLKDIRNTLVHRESPGVTFFMSMQGSPLPPSAQWTRQGTAQEPALVEAPRAWLGDAITRLVGAALSFVTANF